MLSLVRQGKCVDKSYKLHVLTPLLTFVRSAVRISQDVIRYVCI